MDDEAMADQLEVTESISCDSIKKSEKDCAAMETDGAIYLSSPPLVPDHGGALRGPITPYSNKESVNLMSDFTSPLMLASSATTTGSDSHSHESCNNGYMDRDGNSPSTPTEDVFDPFAPGSEKLLLAPHCIKHLEETRSYVARRLKFGPLVTEKCFSETESEDDALLETLYDTLLDAIICKQAEDVLGEFTDLDVPMTPSSLPCLTGIAETCPGAPVKPVRKSRTIDLSSRRRLDFDL